MGCWTKIPSVLAADTRAQFWGVEQSYCSGLYIRILGGKCVKEHLTSFVSLGKSIVLNGEILTINFHSLKYRIMCCSVKIGRGNVQRMNRCSNKKKKKKSANRQVTRKHIYTVLCRRFMHRSMKAQ